MRGIPAQYTSTRGAARGQSSSAHVATAAILQPPSQSPPHPAAVFVEARTPSRIQKVATPMASFALTSRLAGRARLQRVLWRSARLMGVVAWQRRHLVMWCVVLAAGCGPDPGPSPTAPTSGAPALTSASAPAAAATPAAAMAMTLAPDAESTLAGSPLTDYTRTVLAATTTPLMMVTEPGGAINGEIMTTQPVVRLTDAAGHTVTSFTGDVMAWAHTGHTVSNTRTVAAVAGVATFTDLAITGKAENLTLLFTTASGVAVHSAPFPLAIGRAAQARISTQPSGAVAGMVLTTQPVVRITDYGGNTVTTYNGDVSITAGTGPGNVSGTTTVAAVHGVASFTDLAITANTQFEVTTNNLFTVTFTAQPWPPVTSNLIVLTLPAPVPAPVTPAPVAVTAAPAFTLSSASETRTVNTAATGFTINSTGGAIASFAISATPAGMSFSTSTGALTGTPTSVAGATAYTITATNATGSATATFTLTVTAATCAMGGACILGDIGPGGGLVFLISGELRYEMAPKTWGANETTDIQWCNTSTSVTTSTAVGTGSANTTAMLALPCTSGAGVSARAYRGGGLTDWFLPSQDELNAMCNYSRTWTGTPSTLACTGAQNGAFAAGTYGFASDNYWSSSQHPIITSGVWYRFLSDGSDLMGTKGNSFRVRPVRAF